MIKAMLIVASLGLNVEMPNMDSCLEARLAIENQDPTIKTLCVPKADDIDKFEEMFNIFLNMIDRIREYEKIERDPFPEIERFDFHNTEDRETNPWWPEYKLCEDCSG